MEEEVRCILREVLDQEHPRNLADLALELFGPKNGVDLELPERTPLREPPKFD
jgi:plasmid stability protein